MGHTQHALVYCRPRMFIQRPLVTSLVLAVSRGLEEESLAMLWLTSYLFMLRVPSEALSLARGGNYGFIPRENESVLYIESENTVCIQLQSRKNQQRGAIIRRSCSCSGGRDLLCPVHMLWNEFFAELVPGERPWEHLAPGVVRSRLRQTLHRLSVDLGSLCILIGYYIQSSVQVPNSAAYGTHDLRRRHAKVSHLT